MYEQRHHLPQIYQEIRQSQQNGANFNRLLTQNLKNQQSENLVPNFQRLIKIQLRTLSILNNYLQKTPKKTQKISNKKVAQISNTNKKSAFNQIQQSKFRSHSLPIKNQQKINENIKMPRRNSQQVKQNLKLHKIEGKLNKAKILSLKLTEKIQAEQQKKQVEKMSDLNCLGNQWILNLYDPVKLKWRKINKAESKLARAGESLDFFKRNLTSDYEYAKKKINQRVRKFQQQKLQRSQSESKIFHTKSNQQQNLNSQFQNLNIRYQNLNAQQPQKENQYHYRIPLKKNNLFLNVQTETNKSRQSLKLFKQLHNLRFISKSLSKTKIENKQLSVQKQKNVNSSQSQQFRQNSSPFYRSKENLLSCSAKSTNYSDKNKLMENKNRKKLHL